MPELRKDPIIKRWVIIATERKHRPTDFQFDTKETPDNNCPFCEGNESQTPPEITVISSISREPNTPGWDVRVVPNKFPALERWKSIHYSTERQRHRESDGFLDGQNDLCPGLIDE